MSCLVLENFTMRFRMAWLPFVSLSTDVAGQLASLTDHFPHRAPANRATAQRISRFSRYFEPGETTAKALRSRRATCYAFYAYAAKAASVSARTMAPRSTASGEEYSSGRWLTPPRQGMKIIETGATIDMKSES